MTIDKILISSSWGETRVATLSGTRVLDYFFERDADRRLAGNIYHGTVTRVLPGINSAFIDIGMTKAAFLYGGDVINCDHDPTAAPSVSTRDHHTKLIKGKRPGITKLSCGQQVLVQITKEALGKKGPRVSMALSLPGRYLVLMPNFRDVDVSRLISCQKERERLKEILEGITPPGAGLIIRTAAEGATAEEIIRDLNYVSDLWKSFSEKYQQLKVPSLIYEDLGIAEKVIRDHLRAETSEIIIDDAETVNKIGSFFKTCLPRLSTSISLYPRQGMLFCDYGIDVQVNQALKNRVDLQSGAYLVIQETEALCAFDVNTGGFVGKANLRQTILQTNLEAVEEIAYQIRLRNLGGIIVIDFIDMLDSQDREKVYSKLNDRLTRDRVKTNILKISDIGLIQMTRKRTSDSLLQKMTNSCPNCAGTGRCISSESEIFNLLGDLEPMRSALESGLKTITIRVTSQLERTIKVRLDVLAGSLLTNSQVQIEGSLGSAQNEVTPGRSYIMIDSNS